jgi:hypothetical protein
VLCCWLVRGYRGVFTGVFLLGCGTLRCVPAVDSRAHAVVVRALLTGELVRPVLCEACGLLPRGRGKIHAHHADYSRPLEVEWLCPACHRLAGRGVSGSGGGAFCMVSLCMTPSEVADIDRLRGGAARSAWIKDLCRAAVVARDDLGGPGELVVTARPFGDGGSISRGAHVGPHRAGCKCLRCEGLAGK